MTPIMFPIWVNLLIVAAGMILHASTKLSELEMRGQPISVSDYLMRYRFTTISVVMAALALYLLQYALGEGGPVAAFLTGFSCNSAGDKLRAAGDRRMAKLDEKIESKP